MSTCDKSLLSVDKSVGSGVCGVNAAACRVAGHEFLEAVTCSLYPSTYVGEGYVCGTAEPVLSLVCWPAAPALRPRAGWRVGGRAGRWGPAAWVGCPRAVRRLPVVTETDTE